MPKHTLTANDRRKGAQKAAQVKRKKREDARRLAAQYLAGPGEGSVSNYCVTVNTRLPQVRRRSLTSASPPQGL
jgi:hypothetical protein